MTILCSWASFDTEISAVYLASDSRISWENAAVWDNAQKVFAIKETSEIFGYCGDVLFPTQTLSQVTQLASRGLIFETSMLANDRAAAYFNIFQKAIKQYPQQCLAQPFSILYCVSINRVFSVFEFNYDKKEGIKCLNHSLPIESKEICTIGSGKGLFKDFLLTEIKNIGYTSRSVFYALCRTIECKKDNRVGGLPQLVSLYRNGIVNLYGINFYGRNGFLGLTDIHSGVMNRSEWRNENFERWNPENNSIIDGAQRQPRWDITR